MEADDDRDFTTEEIRQLLERIDCKEAEAEDVITSKILMWTFDRFPRLVTSLYIGCRRKGCVPKKWKSARIIPLTKPGKENCKDAFKYRQTNLLNVGIKIHDKMLINRIVHVLYSNNFLNQNCFGFTPQKALKRGNSSKELRRFSA
jgi:hypothetical protein